MEGDSMDIDGPSFLQNNSWITGERSPPPPPLKSTQPLRQLRQAPQQLHIARQTSGQKRKYEHLNDQSCRDFAKVLGVPYKPPPKTRRSPSPPQSILKARLSAYENSITPVPLTQPRAPFNTPRPYLSPRSRTSSSQTGGLFQTGNSFGSQNSHTASHPTHYQPPPPPQPEPLRPLRRIGGMFTSLYGFSRGILASIWSFVTASQQEIVAVETDISGRKRRAIDASSPHTTESIIVPGHFPKTEDIDMEMGPSSASSTAKSAQGRVSSAQSPSQAMPGALTPPDSRPSSSQEQKHDSPMAGASPKESKHNSPMADTVTKDAGTFVSSERDSSEHQNSLPASKSLSSASALAPRPVMEDYDWKPKSGRRPLIRKVEDYPYYRARAAAATTTTFATTSLPLQSAVTMPQTSTRSTPHRRTVLPREARPPPRYLSASQSQTHARTEDLAESKSAAKNTLKDAEIDALINKTKKAVLESPEQTAFRQSWKSRKQREAEAKEAARQRAAREAEEARLREEARAQAEKEEEEAQQAALAEERKRSDPEWIKKQQLIRPLDPEWAEKVTQALETKNKLKSLAITPNGTSISRKDFDTLLGTAATATPWLNDEIINGFLSCISTRKLEQQGYVKNEHSVPAFVAFQHAWYGSYVDKGRSMKFFVRWAKRAGVGGMKLLQAEKLFFPVNRSSHWTLLIISPQDRTLEFLDSLHTGFGPQVFRIAREWLELELGKAYVAEEWVELRSRSAWQQNSDDCGVFTCLNALAAAKGVDFEFVGLGKMADARRLMAAVLLNGGLKGDFEL